MDITKAGSSALWLCQCTTNVSTAHPAKRVNRTANRNTGTLRLNEAHVIGFSP